MYKRNMTDYLAFLCEAFSGRTVLRKIWSGLFFVGLFMLTGCGDFAGNGQGEAAVNASGDNNGVIIEDLTVEYRRNPLGLDEESPVFSWKMKSDERGQLQKAYRIRMAESPEMLADGECVWDTGKVNSDISVAIPYEGNALKAATRYYWEVTVWDKEEQMITSGEESWFETGLLESGWDGAHWIGAGDYKTSDTHILPDSVSYTIDYDFQGAQNADAGFIFGADTDRYGEYYVWAVGVRDEKVCLMTFRMEDYRMYDQETHCLDAYVTAEDYLEKQMHMRIEVDGTAVLTYLDGQKVAESELAEAKPLGRIGLYNDRTEANSFIDNILIVDDKGNELYREDFENENDTVFSPEYIGIQNGRARVCAGVTLVPGDDGPAPYLRKTFETEEKEIISARLYASALGIYNISVNGKSVSENYFDPGQTVYDEMLTYCTYDVTEALQTGENNIMACLGHGWYDRAAGAMGGWSPWGTGKPAVMAKLVINYADGTSQVLVTDESWEMTLDGPIRRDDMYQGEIYDASREIQGWSMEKSGEGQSDGLEDAHVWQAAAVDCVDEKFLDIPIEAHVRESVANTMTLQPVSATSPKPGTMVYDFGQEFMGACRIQVKGEKGDCITIRYAEAVNTENLVNADDIPGTVWTRNLLTARNTDYYFLKGNETEDYMPSMVSRSFRYVQISGLDEDTELLGVEGLVLMSDVQETGTFESSDIWLNRIYHNVFWTQRCNFLDVPTDCPQRDERFGWSGDIALFSSTAVYNMNARSFLKDYLGWLRLQQKEDGAISDIAPHTSEQGHGNNGWGDAIVTITWELYQQYADKGIIEENFEAMCAWVDYLEQTSEDGVRTAGSSYGDHLQYHSTPKELTDTAQSAWSALLLSKMAQVIDRPEEAEKYQRIYEYFRKGWQENWLEEDGMLSAGTQTSYALGLRYSLYPEELEKAASEYLLACVQWAEHHPSVGYVGMPHLLPALSESGYADDAYQVLLKRTMPSWGYEISMGATTMAESWTGYTGYSDGTYGLYGSLNHFAPGSIGEWFYTGILGICPQEENPGFKEIVLKPEITELLQYAGGSYTSMYGTIVSRWENTEEGYIYHVTIPANTSAELFLPLPEEVQAEVSGKAAEGVQTDPSGRVTESGNALETAEGIAIGERTEDGLWLKLVSGSYEFRVLR